MNAPAASILVIDDEPDLRTLYELTLLREGYRVETASTVQEAREQLKSRLFDVVISDMRLPDGFGMEILQDLRDQQRRERCVVMTAYGSAENAVEALRAGAFDYLTKPVRLERLQLALQKAERYVQANRGLQANLATEEVLVIQERNRTERVPLSRVLYFKAELKYITVRTANRSYILDGALNDLEEKFGQQFIRIHRNALVARKMVRSLEKHFDAEEGEGWAVRLQGLDELLSVSRRQLSTVRGVLSQ